MDLLSTKSKGAAAVDGWTWKMLKSRVTPRILTAFCNLWLCSGRVPSRITEGRTTFIPKIAGTMDPGQFRPITVGSTLLRLYHGILGKRIEQQLPISQRQKGFRKGDEIFFNSLLLQKCIRKAKTEIKNLSMAFLDTRKAFDSVGHGAIWAACRRLGVPRHLIEYFSRFYAMSSTRLVLGDRLSDKITSKRGIKQGDPVSVHLFNAVIDLCTSRMNHQIGFKLDADSVLSYMAFADDLVIVSETKEGLEVNVELLMQGLKKAGFAANPAKSATLNIVARSGKWLCDERSVLKIDGNDIPGIGVKDTYRYLGVDVGVGLEGSNPKRMLTTYLEKLTRAPLKPQQRMYLLRNYLLPKVYHQLVMLQPRAKTLNTLDFLVRSEVKKWMKVKVQCPSSFIYSDVKDGGLGVPSLRYLIPRLRHQRLCRLTGSEDTLAPLIYNLEDLAAPVVAGKTVSSKEDIRNIWKEKLADSVDGKGLLQHQVMVSTLRWKSITSCTMMFYHFLRVC